MSCHTEQEFQTFMSQLVETHETLSFYTDFEKCYGNVQRVAIKLNQLNYLLGCQNIEDGVRELWRENAAVFEVLAILVAVRQSSKKKVVSEEGVVRYMADYFKSPESVLEFLAGTGLKEVFENKSITNLVDYVFGVEVGLDTNARKNRSGHMMEAKVRRIVEEIGLPFEAEVEASSLDIMQKTNSIDVKRFDFVIRSTRKIYLLEVNFYGSGGSKLNEVARSYTELASKINSVPGYEFVWITDGRGWRSARKPLEEAFYAIQNIYNLATLADFACILERER